jgi:hypothetical protein
MKTRCYPTTDKQVIPAEVHEPYEPYLHAPIADNIELSTTGATLPDDFHRGITGKELLARLLPRIERLTKQ